MWNIRDFNTTEFENCNNNNNKPLKYPKDCKLSNNLKDFINKTLITDPNKRITLSQALKHEWLEGKNVSNTKLNEYYVT